MKHILRIGSILILIPGAVSISAQSPRAGERSPKEVIQDFWNMEMGGGRLTPMGWNRAAMFFAHPSPPPRDKVVIVTFEGTSVDETARTGNEAQVTLECDGAGQIDSALRFKPSATGPVEEKWMCQYTLALTDKHWELGPNGALKEVTGHPEWRITKGPPGLRIGLRAAIRYVTETRDRSTDPAIKKNADETLAKLLKLH